MKAKILYAPVLLLSLSMACGKAENKSSVSSDVSLQKVVKAAEKIEAVSRAHPVVADEETPPAPAANGTPATTPAATPAAGAPSETDPDSAEAPVPTNAPAETETAEEAEPITSGNKAIDAICAQSFKALQATTQEELDAVQLTVATNNSCQKVLLSTGAALVTELTGLGVSLGLPTGTGTVALTPALFTNVLTSNPEYGDLFLSVIDTNVFYNQTYFLPDANEKLEYVKISIAELTADGVENLSADQKNSLMMLNLSLEVQQGTVDKFNNRIAKLGSLANFTSLAAGVGFVGQVIAAPAAAPAQ